MPLITVMCWKITGQGNTQTRFMRTVLFCIFLFSIITSTEDFHKKIWSCVQKRKYYYYTKSHLVCFPFLLFMEVWKTIPLRECNVRAPSVLCWFWDKTSIMIFHFALTLQLWFIGLSGSCTKHFAVLILFNPCKNLCGRFKYFSPFLGEGSWYVI